MRTGRIARAVVVAVLGMTVAACRHSGAAAPAASTAPIPESTPSAAPAPSPGADLTGPLDLVLAGVDTRITEPGWEPHSDAIMLLHVDAGLKSAYLYSLPRDLLVQVPAYPKAGFPGGRHKLTEAMAFGSRIPGRTAKNVANGYDLLTRTISAYTGIRTFQAGAILNFGGLDRLVDELGGIDMTIDQKVKSRHRRPDGTLRKLSGHDYTGPQAVYLPGKRHLVGWQAIDYARQRYGLPNGDYDRQRHQRQMVEAILDKALGEGLSDPAKLQPVITALGKTLVTVGGRQPIDYAYALRDLTPSSVTMVQLDGGGVGSGSGYLGEALNAEARGFLSAVAAGTIAAYLKAHPGMVDKG
ncbi:LytR family transcriptional regulator [Actinoplanes sp. SE50]|uniref:LCP family protein n=1 Tax=unclassified Actinoplanes TaxID=2626549 RepID=UPI00023EBCA6|nr:MULTISPECIES: LCP family protein [unclassified Actinoplanes]AEV81769.1 Membrane-bound protein lytR [Actinoplanes sp. SE50/110]ATO80170.1 LytR family transcriptional regulator [Actinoplanes sp. SE50]SLL97574.1 LytR family transcriptional regulator [Actinoplanes sp. SE50/110]